MKDKRKVTILRLRPHHICCIPFLNFDGGNLDKRFFEVLTDTKQKLTSQPELTVIAVEGVDDVCHACPSCVDDRCASPTIEEEMVRKLDQFLLRDLRKSYGETLKVSQWQSLISEKWPYRLCRICRWREYCSA
jgi:hypothetical protein